MDPVGDPGDVEQGYLSTEDVVATLFRAEAEAGQPHGPHAPSSAAARALSWSPKAERQITTYCFVAQLNAAMNEKAALLYRRLDTAAIIVVSLLTVVTGSQSLPLLSSPLSDTAPSPGTRGFTIFAGVCGIALGALASMLSRLDWKTKAATYARRAVGYARLAATIRLQLALDPTERDGARATLERISSAIARLEAMGDPLPPHYRSSTRVDQGVMSLWGASRSSINLRQTANPGDPTAHRPHATDAHHRFSHAGFELTGTGHSPTRQESGDSSTSSPQDTASALAASLAPVEGDHTVVGALEPGPEGDGDSAGAGAGIDTPPPHPSPRPRPGPHIPRRCPPDHDGGLASLCWQVRQEMGCCGTIDPL